MADLNNIEKKLDLILQKQQELENKMNKMENIINKIESDIYLDEGFDFEIVCPYCNNEFITDIDENKTEVECPECHNTIELEMMFDGCGCDCEDCEHDDCDCDDCDCDCEDEVYEIECPACNDVIYLDADMLEEEGMTCPNCGESLEFSLDDEDEE